MSEPGAAVVPGGERVCWYQQRGESAIHRRMRSHLLASFPAGTSAFPLLRFRLVLAYSFFFFFFYVVKTEVIPALTAEGHLLVGAFSKAWF